MKQSRLLSQAVKLALTAGVAATWLTAPAAQAADQGTANLGKVEVTGSRIKRTDVETSQPVLTITRQALAKTGLRTVGEILQKMTSAGASLSTLSNYTGNFTFTGGGENNVDLRNLGSKRVLVLVNGRRWVTSLNGTVDLDTIPASIVDHIEVLQDGASAIYGSDAISGVINIITRKNFNGHEAHAYYGEYMDGGHHDGKSQSYDFTIGSTSDTSGVLFNVAYTKQDAISAADRAISREPTANTGVTRGSSGMPQGRFVFIPSGPPLSTSANCPVTSFGTFSAPLCDLTLTTGASGTSASDFRPFSNTDRFNYAPYNYVLTPQERFSAYGQAHTDITDNVTFTTDVVYSHRDSKQQAAPTPLFFASSSLALTIPANQPYNPFGYDLNATGGPGTNLLLIGRRMIENGPRRFTEASDTFRFSAGFNGTFEAAGKAWDWDVAYIFGKDRELDTNYGRFNVANLTYALGDPATCAAQTGCVPLNLFGGQGSITPAMLNYIGFVEQNQFENNMRVYDGNITNSDLFDLPAGPLGFAAGYEYRERDGFFQPDPVAVAGNDSFNPGIPVQATKGRFSEDSYYVEFDVPLLSDMPFAKTLDLDVASRHSNFTTFGGNTTSRAGLKYQPTEDVLIRASWSQGFRAPNLNELFAGQSNVSTQVADPCSSYSTTGVSASVQAACQAAGVPTSYTQSNTQINVLEGGNPNLKPETSISRTLGVVWNPDWLDGFSVNADYYKIELENTIQPLGGQNIVNGCYIGGNTADCALIQRSQTFGNILSLNDTQSNIGGTSTDGIDAGASYHFTWGDYGDFTAKLETTYIKSYKEILPDGTVTELTGVERGGTVFPFGVPHYKTHLSLDWNYGNWTADWTVRYTSALTEPCTDYLDGTPNSLTALGLCSNPNTADNTKSTNHLGATIYHDVQATYDFNDYHTTVTFGIRNLFNKAPPISTQQQLNSFDPTLYDVPGMFPYLRVSTTF